MNKFTLYIIQKRLRNGDHGEFDRLGKDKAHILIEEKLTNRQKVGAFGHELGHLSYNMFFAKMFHKTEDEQHARKAWCKTIEKVLLDMYDELSGTQKEPQRDRRKIGLRS